jgi:hypothetical protein
VDGTSLLVATTPSPTLQLLEGAPRTAADHLHRLRTRVAELTQRCDDALRRVADDGGLDPGTHLAELRRVALRGERRPTAARRAQLELAFAVVRRPDRERALSEVATEALPALVTDLHRLERALARSAAVGHARTA